MEGVAGGRSFDEVVNGLDLLAEQRGPVVEGPKFSLRQHNWGWAGGGCSATGRVPTL